MTVDKTALREKYRHIRKVCRSVEKDEIIFQLLIGSDEYIAAEKVFIYYSVGSEVNTVKIINDAIERGKRVALPKCTDNKGNMDFYFVKSIFSSLTDGMFSLKEPDVSVCERAVPGESDLCVVPALAFDKSGYRLGYGGGYYDRYLSVFNGKKIGLCYEECLCNMLPSDKYDIKVDMIITDRKIYKVK